MIVYVTKYCLTGPIVACELESESPPYAYVKWHNGINGTMLVRASEWHVDKEMALAHANIMRKRKIQSMKKSIQKLEDREFTFRQDGERPR